MEINFGEPKMTFGASHGEPSCKTSPSQRVILGLLCAALFFSACGSDPQEVRPHRGEQKVVSLDLLGILHEDFPCEKYLEEMRDATEINIGYLAGGTFGEERICLAQVLQDRRLVAVRVHLTSWPCVRYRRCHVGESLSGISTGNDRRILNRVIESAKREFEYLARSLDSEVRLYVSPSLEHDISEELFSESVVNMLDIAFQNSLTVEPVDNPLIPRPSKWLLEVHNFYAPSQFPYIFSTDGYFGFEVESMLDANRDALLNFEWRPEFNALCTDGRPWKYPNERDKECW